MYHRARPRRHQLSPWHSPVAKKIFKVPAAADSGAQLLSWPPLLVPSAAHVHHSAPRPTGAPAPSLAHHRRCPWIESYRYDGHLKVTGCIRPLAAAAAAPCARRSFFWLPLPFAGARSALPFSPRPHHVHGPSHADISSCPRRGRSYASLREQRRHCAAYSNRGVLRSIATASAAGDPWPWRKKNPCCQLPGHIVGKSPLRADPNIIV